MVMNRDLPRPSSTTSIRDDPGSKKGWTGSSSYVHELERQVKVGQPISDGHLLLS